MRIYALLFLFLFSACTNIEIILSKEDEAKNKIHNNKTIAINAKEEYRNLQIQREQE